MVKMPQSVSRTLHNHVYSIKIADEQCHIPPPFPWALTTQTIYAVPAKQ